MVVYMERWSSCSFRMLPISWIDTNTPGNVQVCDLELAKFLTNKSADINVKDKAGTRILHKLFASSFYCSRLVHLINCRHLINCPVSVRIEQAITVSIDSWQDYLVVLPTVDRWPTIGSRHHHDYVNRSSFVDMIMRRVEVAKAPSSCAIFPFELSRGLLQSKMIIR